MSAGADAGPGSSPGGLGALLASPGVLAISLWGASFVATRAALAGFTPAGLVATRFLLGAAVVGGVQLARRKPFLPERSDRARCLLLGAILGGHILLQAFALRFTTALHSGWIVSFSAVAVTLGAALFLGERLAARNALGVALAVCGVGLVVASHTPDFERATTGDLLVFASAFSWAAYTLLSKRPIQNSGAGRVTPLVMATAGAVAFVAALPGGFTLAAVPAAALGAVVFLGLGSSGVAFYAWSRTIERFGALRAGVLIYLQPFVTLVLATVLLDEPAGWSALLGGPIVLLGVALASRR